MSAFDFKAAIEARPAQRDLIRVLGDPRGARAVPGDRRGTFIPDPAWARSRLVRVEISDLPGWPMYAGRPVSAVTMERGAAAHLVATWAEVRRRGLHTRLRSYDGAFMPRHMLWNPANDLSAHAFGRALDFDAATNGYGIPARSMQIDRDFVRCMEECGWTWGGRWTETDGMHFQLTDPLPGTTVPEWQDAMARKVSVAKPAPAEPTTVWAQVRDTSGQPIDGLVVSIPVSSDGRLLVMADGRPKITRVPERRLGERKY